MTLFPFSTKTIGLASLVSLSVGCDELQLAELQVDSAAPIIEPLTSDDTQSEFDAEILAIWMDGSFVSMEGDEPDASDESIQTLMTVCSLQQSDDGEDLVYLEETAFTGSDRIVGQKLYAITETPAGLELSNYLLRPEEALRLQGACNDPESVKVDAALIALAADCAVPIQRAGKDSFGGSTVGLDCPSDRRGTSVETLSIVVKPLTIDLWSRGYDEAGDQLWGPLNGPVQYRRVR